MLKFRRSLPWIMCLVGGAAAAQVTPAVTSRGELLYNTHCIACHRSKIHWRDARQASDWASLRALVTRWQAEAKLGWSEGDVDEVARYLNDVHYHFPPASRRAARSPPASSG